MLLPARPKRHLLAVLALALLVAPGTFVRTTVPGGVALAVTIALLPFDGRQRDGLAVAGLWELDSAGENFGGYSAMLLRERDGIKLFSDKGFVLAFARPDPRSGPARAAPLPARSRQLPATPPPANDLFDIESVTRSPVTGQTWVGFESRHTIYRYGADGLPQAFVQPDYTRAWADNGGIEAMVRMRDGRFMVFHEGGRDLFVYPADPVAGAAPGRFVADWPAGFRPTDAADMPDGRVLLLLRKVGWHLPVFESLLVLIDPARLGESPLLPVTTLARIEDRLPRDNWEALAVEPGSRPGEVGLWLAADDNRSIFQRSLLARIRLTVPPRDRPQTVFRP